MKSRPISFNAEMVRALLAGRKTQTRRPIREAPEDATRLRLNARGHLESYVLDVADDPVVLEQMKKEGDDWWPVVHPAFGCETPVRCPFGRPGDRLWVREKTRLWDVSNATGKTQGGLPVKLRYEADGEESGLIVYPKRLARLCVGYCVPNGCYREASRITLDVTRVWVGQVQEITLVDSRKEGLGGVSQFQRMWNAIYSKKDLSWEKNPPVWCCEFKVVDDAK
jgi:hypothetical protein